MPIATLISTILVLVAGGDPPQPNVEITPILHQGDPAPGIPDATIVWLGIPHIDGAGNVLTAGYYEFDGDPFSHSALWYGAAGSMHAVMYDGIQAPDLPSGVHIRHRANEWLSESGWIGFTGFLAGPGIIPLVNDKAVFVGPPGDLRLVLQGGDPAPDLPPGVIIDVSHPLGFGANLSDNATLLLFGWLSGPQVDETNDRAVWIGPRDDLHLIWREGMDAPGTNGARFAWHDFVKFNDNAEIAFRGGLVNEGDIDYTNDGGVWAGPAGDLELIAREADPAPGTPDGVYFWGFNPPAFNRFGDVAFSGLLAGVGVTSDNDTGLWLNTAQGFGLVGREGDPAPEVGPDVAFDEFGGLVSLSARQEIFHPVTRVEYGVPDPVYDNLIRFFYEGQFLDPGSLITRQVGAPQNSMVIEIQDDLIIQSEIHEEARDFDVSGVVLKKGYGLAQDTKEAISPDLDGAWFADAEWIGCVKPWREFEVFQGGVRFVDLYPNSADYVRLPEAMYVDGDVIVDAASVVDLDNLNLYYTGTLNASCPGVNFEVSGGCPTPVSKSLYGDWNMDCKLDPRELIHLKRHIYDPENYPYEPLHDLDCDGVINEDTEFAKFKNNVNNECDTWLELCGFCDWASCCGESAGGGSGSGQSALTGEELAMLAGEVINSDEPVMLAQWAADSMSPDQLVVAIATLNELADENAGTPFGADLTAFAEALQP